MNIYCYKHPEIQTVIRCGNCDRPICVKCMVQHPVGIKCVECAKSRRLPVFDVSPLYLARAMGAAAGIGITGVICLYLFSVLSLPLGPATYYLRWIALVGIGYLMGTGVNLAVNHKRGRRLQWIVGIGVMATFLGAASLFPQAFALNSLFALIALGVAVYVAVTQLRI